MPVAIADVRTILNQKNINFLYHANTVATITSFFKAGGLLSRGAVEDLGLFQTSQMSDSSDKALGIWYDVFFDSVDIHSRAKELNKYGPVMLVFSTDLLSMDGITAKITRDNPVRWDTDMPEEHKYFDSIETLQNEYIKGAFYQHLTICRITNAIPFDPYLVEVVLDNPTVEDSSHFEKAHEWLSTILKRDYPKVQLSVRDCSSDCSCKDKYRSYNPRAIWHKYQIP